MKKAVCILTLLLWTAGFLYPSPAAAYNYGDFRSETLTSKAWGALNDNDLEAVLAYTNKCIELYSEAAKKMQNSLNDYPQGPEEEIHGYWALNDVSTSLFIQGEAYRKAQMNGEALAAYKQIVSDYSYGQAWDAGNTNEGGAGWFWKPAQAAKEKIAMIESGSNLDFGDYKSSTLTTKAWMALKANDTNAVVAYTDKILELYEEKAKEMQGSMTEYAWETVDEIFSKWALNDVGTALYIRGELFKNTGDYKEAKKAYKKLVDNYFYAQCWDPGPDNEKFDTEKGWFWKPAEAAQEALDSLESI
jgi:tetratricopeptide (TPR) repeat protein